MAEGVDRLVITGVSVARVLLDRAAEALDAHLVALHGPDKAIVWNHAGSVFTAGITQTARQPARRITAAISVGGRRQRIDRGTCRTQVGALTMSGPRALRLHSKQPGSHDDPAHLPIRRICPMNATERGIREQFPLWDRVALVDARPTPDRMQIVVGCGTSVHIADAIACALNAGGALARAVSGNEWTRRRQDYAPSDTPVEVIALSRSGESTETVAAARASRQAGVPVLGITCADGSALCAESDRVIYAETHAEEGIVMTASASLMLLVGLRYAGVAIGPDTTRAADSVLHDGESALPGLIDGRTHFVFLGGGAFYGVAREAALKMQEMSLSQSEAHHPLEYRHGPISLVDDRSLVVLLYHPQTREEESVLAADLMAKGAKVLGLGGPGTVSLPVGGDTGAGPLVCLPLLQMLGEVVARARGLDTLAPRHLTKVVTVS